MPLRGTSNSFLHMSTPPQPQVAVPVQIPAEGAMHPKPTPLQPQVAVPVQIPVEGAMPPPQIATFDQSAPAYTPEYPVNVLVQPQHTMPMQLAFGPDPQPLNCPQCKAQGITAVEKQPGLGAWLLAGGLCCLGCCCCAPIPLLVDNFKDSIHRCTSCNAVVGEKKLIN